jgi:hypothetical protein
MYQVWSVNEELKDSTSSEDDDFDDEKIDIKDEDFEFKDGEFYCFTFHKQTCMVYFGSLFSP